MSIQSFDPQQPILDFSLTMTDVAVDHFRQQLLNKSETYIRLFLQKSGCSGYMYRIELIDEPPESHVKVEIKGLVIYVAHDACVILNGTEIDFSKQGLNKVIKFNNPNVTAECGCGESFVVEE